MNTTTIASSSSSSSSSFAVDITAFVKELIKLNSCFGMGGNWDKVEWFEGYERGGKSLEEAWEACPRGDWLLWIAAKAGVDKRLVTATACAVAKTVLQYIPEKEEEVASAAIEAAEAWIRKGGSIEAVKAASQKASLLSYSWAGKTPVFSEAIAAAAAAAMSVDTGISASIAAAFAGYAEDFAHFGCARALAQIRFAGIVRGMIPLTMVKKAMGI